MKRIIILLLPLVLGACASNKKAQVNNLCDNYSNAYVAAAMSRENGLTLGEAKSCAVASTTDLDHKKICKGDLSKATKNEVNKKIISAYNNRENYKDAMTIMMVTAVVKVYNSPEMNPYEWKIKSTSICKMRSNV